VRWQQLIAHQCEKGTPAKKKPDADLRIELTNRSPQQSLAGELAPRRVARCASYTHPASVVNVYNYVNQSLCYFDCEI
jgi:hypothetical protein